MNPLRALFLKMVKGEYRNNPLYEHADCTELKPEYYGIKVERRGELMRIMLVDEKQRELADATGWREVGPHDTVTLMAVRGSFSIYFTGDEDGASHCGNGRADAD